MLPGGGRILLGTFPVGPPGVAIPLDSLLAWQADTPLREVSKVGANRGAKPHCLGGSHNQPPPPLGLHLPDAGHGCQSHA
jgi:hypothetical protein